MPTVKTLSQNEMNINRQVSIVGIIFGLLAVLAGAEPTGFFWVDVLYSVVAVTIVVLIGSRAPWWVITLHIAVAAAMTFSTTGVLVGGALYLVTLVYSSRAESSRLMKSALVGASVNLMFYSQWAEVFGVSSLVGAIAVRRRSVHN